MLRKVWLGPLWLRPFGLGPFGLGPFWDPVALLNFGGFGLIDRYSSDGHGSKGGEEDGRNPHCGAE